MDTVTLLQMEKGVRIYDCRFFSSSGLYSFKSMDHDLAGKMAVVAMSSNKRTAHKVKRSLGGSDFDDEQVLEPNGENFGPPSYGVVRVMRDVTDTFEPTGNIVYNWIVKVLDEDELGVLPGVDAEARRQIRLGRAYEEARNAVGNRQVKLLPSGTELFDALVRPSTEKKTVAEDDVPF